MHRIPLVLLAIAYCLIAFPATPSATRSAYNASLSGREAVPPVDTKARGQMHFKIEGDELTYRLTLANVSEVRYVGVLMAPAGQTGSQVVLLYRTGPVEPDRSPQWTSTANGVFLEGTITQIRLVGPLDEGTVADLVDAMRNGNIYVSVSTQDGEIRGQVK